MHVMLTKIIILSLFFLKHCHSYIAVHFLKVFLLLVYLIFCFKKMPCRLQLWHCMKLVGSVMVPLRDGLCLLLRYRNITSYTKVHICLHTSYISAAQMAKNSCMTLCCQNQEYRGTGQHYGLHSSANTSVHSASVAVLCLLKKEEEEEKKKELVQKLALFPGSPPLMF